ncbi:MAG TPA: arginase family protein, partial [Longimicrobiales bacterium]|nr:arginase family protein [Longimicrobiales bacterium]
MAHAVAPATTPPAASGADGIGGRRPGDIASVSERRRLERGGTLPPKLAGHAWATPSNFLGLEPEDAAWDTSGVVILPIPYEATTSWGGGTRDGPRAILEASRYVELYDEELDTEPFR